MNRLSLYFSVALFTFVLGPVSINVWYTGWQPSVKQSNKNAPAPTPTTSHGDTIETVTPTPTQSPSPNDAIPTSSPDFGPVPTETLIPLPDVVPSPGPITPESSPCDVPPQDCEPTFEGRYSNNVIGFSTVIPKGMVGYRDCGTITGFKLSLSSVTSRYWINQTTEESSSQSYLHVKAGWLSQDRSFKDAMKIDMDLLKYSGPAVTNIELVSETQTKLSDLPAIRFVVKYNTSGKAMVRDVVLAFKKEKIRDVDYSSGDKKIVIRDRYVMFSISLTTPASRYDKDKNLINEIQETWQLILGLKGCVVL